MNVYPGRFFHGEAPPVDVRACINCGKMTTATLDEHDPLCEACDLGDDVAAKEHAIAAAFDARTQVIRRETLPVEHARSAVRPFGLGFGEIASSKITQALAEDQRGNPPVLGAFLVASTLATMLGLLVLAIAAVR